MNKPSATWMSGVLLLIVLTLFRCGGDGGGGGGTPVLTGGSQAGTPTLTSVAVTPQSQTVIQGTAQQFSATGTFSDATMQDITATATWTSSDETKAIVSSTGMVTGVGVGSATITASAGNVSGSAALTIMIVSRGDNWRVTPSGTSRDLQDITWSGTNYVVVGEDGTILTSP